MFMMCVQYPVIDNRVSLLLELWQFLSVYPVRHCLVWLLLLGAISPHSVRIGKFAALVNQLYRHFIAGCEWYNQHHRQRGGG